MYKPDDKDIDRLSRDAAEHYNAPGQPSWDALQQILDKELPREKEKKRRGFLFFFLLLLGISVAGTGVWYGLQISSKNKTATKTDNARNAGAPAASQSTTTQPAAGNSPEIAADGASGTPATQHKQLPATGAAAAVIKNKPGNTKDEPAESSASGNHKTTGASILPSANKDITTENNNQPAANSKGPLRKGGQVAKTPGSRTSEVIFGTERPDAVNTVSPGNRHGNKNKGAVVLADNNLKKKKSGNKDNEQIASPETSIPVTSDNTDADIAKSETVVPGKKIDQPAAAKDTLRHSATIAAVPVVTDPQTVKKDSALTAKKKSKSKNDRAINIGITAGIDESTVKYKYGENAGFNIGIMGGYQFSKHWAAYTGIVYTKKNYKLKGEDYHPPKHYWTQYVQLDLVDGDCRMWELPLQARYTFNPGSKTAFFASAGLSSYFMKKQSYNYYYKSMGTPTQAYWTNDSTFNHIFSILHLSAGFEKKLGKHMNWQIEPYAKIPLGGVGFGNIRLSSFGINVTVQYRQPIKR